MDRLKVKLGGSSAKSDDDMAQDHWDAECADCGEEGDLLCCEVSYVPAVLCWACYTMPFKAVVLHSPAVLV